VKDESGATAIEYGLIAAGISVAIIAVVNGLGTKLNTTFSSISGHGSLLVRGHFVEASATGKKTPGSVLLVQSLVSRDMLIGVSFRNQLLSSLMRCLSWAPAPKFPFDFASVFAEKVPLDVSVGHDSVLVCSRVSSICMADSASRCWSTARV
jgi:pilus assembly protein Flp/PilA